jgi:carbonic anhydrase
MPETVLCRSASSTNDQRHDDMSPARLAAVAAVLLAAALLRVVPGARGQEETEHEEEFSYVPGDEHGPEHWGSIKAEWAACGAGRMQSPIDLSHERVSLVRSLGYLSHSYRPAEASIVNRGHDIMVRDVTFPARRPPPGSISSPCLTASLHAS